MSQFTDTAAEQIALRIKAARSHGIGVIDVTVDVVEALLEERVLLLERLGEEPRR